MSPTGLSSMVVVEEEGCSGKNRTLPFWNPLVRSLFGYLSKRDCQLLWKKRKARLC